MLIPKPSNANASLGCKVAWMDSFKQELGPLLQLYGTEFRRAQDPFYWVNKLRAKIEAEQPQVALISDMRFKNEAYYVKAFKGYTVKVTRHGYTDLSRLTTHQSEVDLADFKFDFELTVAEGAIDQLKKDAVTVFDMIVQAETFDGIPEEVMVA